MKKLLCIILITLCCVLFITPIYADSYGSKIEMVFKDGSDIVKINGQEVKIEKPISSKGVLLVPLKVIADAFSAQLDVSNNKTATLKYNGMTMVYTVGSKDALIDGKKTVMQEAPKLVTTSFMVPLRFVAENLGAEVKYDKNTSSTIVTKEIAGDNSIKDFALILKKTSKERIGDSYLNWSLALPKNVKITYRSFSGSYNAFEAYDGSYSLYMGIRDLTNETLDSILSDKLAGAADFTMISQSKETMNGQEFLKVAYKDEDGTYEDRVYIKGNKIYELDLEVYKYEDYLNNKILSSMMDSFKLEFLKNSNIEDLSDVNANGYRPYAAKKYKWSINVLADWTKDTSVNRENFIRFNENSKDKNSNANTLVVQMYSKEPGLTLESWVQKDITTYKDRYNPDIVNVLGTFDINVNGINAKQVRLTTKLSKMTVYTFDTYFLGKDYKYLISYTYNSANSIDVMNKISAMLSTFKYTDPDPKVIGQLLDTEYITISSGVRKIENKDERWSMELPVRWITQEKKDSEASATYMDSKNYMYATIFVKKSGTLKGYVKEFDDYLANSSSGATPTILDKKVVIQDKGTTVTVYHYTTYYENDIVKQRVYMLEKNGMVYMIFLSVDDFTKSAKNIMTLDTIWQSFKFE